jgi:hypothetical protein
MDYPHPLVNIVNGKIDYSNAYAVGIGEWDKIAVAYAYGVYINEEESLNKVLDDAAKAGYRNISDEDSRDRGGCNPYGHLWDNGADAVDELKNVLAVRKKAIEQFSIHNIRSGEGHDKLEEVFVPLYFYHRYQTEAAVKLIAGIDFHYGQKGDGLPLPKVIDVTRQREALNAILETTTSEVLAIPQEQLQLMAPRGMYSNGRETMSGKTGPAFDAIGAATTSANFTFKLLLHPARASRLIQQNVMDENQLSLEDVLDELLNRYVENEFENTFKKEIHEAVNAELLTCLMSLAQDEDAYAHVGSAVDMKLAELQEHLDDKKSRTKYDRSYLHDLNIYFKDPSKVKKKEVDKIPDGSPIGSGCSYE